MERESITHIGRDETGMFGVAIYICGNAEVIADAIEDPSGNGWADEAHEATGAAIAALHSIAPLYADYTVESSFAAYKGGPRKSLGEVVLFIANIDREINDDGSDGDEIIGEWRVAQKDEVPEKLRAQVAAIEAAMTAAMEAAIDELIRA